MSVNFIAKFGCPSSDGTLVYPPGDYSFILRPHIKGVTYCTILNGISIDGKSGKRIADVGGWCPYGNWKHAVLAVPHFQEGSLEIVTDEEPWGGSRSIIEWIEDASGNSRRKDWPEYVDIEKGWVCIGNPEAKGEAVEFIRNCVAVISNGEMQALWLKPVALPLKEIAEFAERKN